MSSFRETLLNLPFAAALKGHSRSASTLAGLVQEGSLYALLFLLPFSKAAIEVLFGFLFFGWLADRLNPKIRTDTVWLRPAFRPLAWAILGYLAVCALSIGISSDPASSIRGLIGKWLEYLLYFIIVADVAARPKVLERSLQALAWGAAFVFLEAISQERYGCGFFLGYRLDFFQRMTGPYENPLDLATYLMVVFPVLLMHAVTRRTASRWFLWGLLALLAGCLARTGAVGAWLGLSAGSLVMLMWKSPVRRSTTFLLVAAGLAAGVLILHQQGRLGAKLSLSDIGTQDRLHMWQAAIKMIRDRPLLGHGLNTFMANYLRYWVGGEHQPRYAHNCYLQVAAETGFIGLAAFLGLLWLLFARIVAGLRRISSADQSILLGFAVGLFAFALQAGIDTNFYSMRQVTLFFVMAGLAVGLSERASIRQQT